jgi:hypothetical protein
MKAIRIALGVSGCLCLLAGALALLSAAQALQRAANALDRAESDVQKGIVTLNGELDSTRTALIGLAGSEMEGVRGQANDQITALRKDTMAQLTDMQGLVDRRTGEALKLAGDQLTAIRGDLKPTLDNTAKVTADADKLVTDIHPEAVGFMRDSRAMAVEAARTTLYIRQQTPAFLQTWQDIGLHVKETTDASAKASEATAVTMGNLAEATKPLPKWFRYTVGIGASISPVAIGIISGLATTGAFNR